MHPHEESVCTIVKPIVEKLLQGLDVTVDKMSSEESDARKADMTAKT